MNGRLSLTRKPGTSASLVGGLIVLLLPLSGLTSEDGARPCAELLSSDGVTELATPPNLVPALAAAWRDLVGAGGELSGEEEAWMARQRGTDLLESYFHPPESLFTAEIRAALKELKTWVDSIAEERASLSSRLLLELSEIAKDFSRRSIEAAGAADDAKSRRRIARPAIVPVSTQGEVVLPPAVLRDGSVIVATQGGWIHHFAEDGNLLGDYRTGWRPVYAPLALDDGGFVLGTNLGADYYFNADLTLRAQLRFPDGRGHSAFKPLVLRNGNLLFGSTTGWFRLVSPQGEILQVFHGKGMNHPVALETHDGSIALFHPQRLVLLAPNGDVKQSISLEAEGGFRSRPLELPDGNFLIGSENATLHRIQCNGMVYSRALKFTPARVFSSLSLVRFRDGSNLAGSGKQFVQFLDSAGATRLEIEHRQLAYSEEKAIRGGTQVALGVVDPSTELVVAVEIRKSDGTLVTYAPIRPGFEFSVAELPDGRLAATNLEDEIVIFDDTGNIHSNIPLPGKSQQGLTTTHNGTLMIPVVIEKFLSRVESLLFISTEAL